MTTANLRQFLLAGILIGIGMGGFVDGILFHQILQLHNMLSNVVPRDTLIHEQVNMFWDGLFHAFCFMTAACGIVLFWRRARLGAPPHFSAFAGSLLLGWGLFNVVEGVIDHEILQVHHVYQNGNHLLWDLVFLLAGVLFCVLGSMLMRTRDIPRSVRTGGPGLPMV